MYMMHYTRATCISAHHVPSLIHITRFGCFLISINPNSIGFPERPNRVQSARRHRKTRGRDQWIWLVNQRITVIESNRGEPSNRTTLERRRRRCGNGAEGTDREKENRWRRDKGCRRERWECRRVREYGWRNGRERRQMRKSLGSRARRGAHCRNSRKCDSISRPGTRDLCRGSRSSNQRSVRFNQRWEAPGACVCSLIRSFALSRSSTFPPVGSSSCIMRRQSTDFVTTTDGRASLCAASNNNEIERRETKKKCLHRVIVAFKSHRDYYIPVVVAPLTGIKTTFCHFAAT